MVLWLSPSLHLGVQVEVGSILTPDGSQACPANILVRDRIAGRFADLDFNLSLSHRSNQAYTTRPAPQFKQQKPIFIELITGNAKLGGVALWQLKQVYENWAKTN